MNSLNFYNNFNLKFLIADDDIRVCQAIKTRLSHYNCDVITASDGEEALFIFKKEQPDLTCIYSNSEPKPRESCDRCNYPVAYSDRKFLVCTNEKCGIIYMKGVN